MNNHGAHKSEILFCQSLDVMAAGSIFHGRVDFVFHRKRRRTRTWPQMATTSPESSLSVNAVYMRECIFQWGLSLAWQTWTPVNSSTDVSCVFLQIHLWLCAQTSRGGTPTTSTPTNPKTWTTVSESKHKAQPGLVSSCTICGLRRVLMFPLHLLIQWLKAWRKPRSCSKTSFEQNFNWHRSSPAAFQSQPAAAQQSAPKVYITSTCQ